MGRMAERSPGRLDFIEGMRGLAALYVVFQHIASFVDPQRRLQWSNAEPSLLGTLTAPLWFGHLAVAAFIVISGYCLQLAQFNRAKGKLDSYGKYMKRRARRILPPYYACLALSLVVALFVTSRQEGLPWEQYLPVTTESTLAHVFLVHNWQPEWMYKINGVLWSIAIEFQLYFLFPLIVALIWRAGRVPTLVLAVVAAGALLAFVPNGLKLYFWFLGLFAMGAVAAHYALTREPSEGQKRGMGVLALLGFVATAALTYWTNDPTNADVFGGAGWVVAVRDTAVGVAVALFLIFGTWRPEAPTSRALGWRPIFTLGVFSYSLYLMHHPIMQVLVAYRPEFVEGQNRLFVYLLAVLPIVIGACYLFFWLFERPFLKRPEPKTAGAP
jgi:peptidoglycan/LPS O-acetylase OafA/YrhL